MEADKNLLKEINDDLRKDRILKLIKLYRKYIIATLLIGIVTLSAYLSYDYYIKRKADANSIVFSEVKNAVVAEDIEGAILLLDSLIEDGTEGYVFLAYMEKSGIYLSQGKTKEAVEVLQQAYKNVSLPKYYLEMIKSMEFMHRLNIEQDLTVLEKDIKAVLNPKDSFYFYNLEMYGSLLFMMKKYDESLLIYQQILDDKKSPKLLLDRAKRAKSILISYKK